MLSLITVARRLSTHRRFSTWWKNVRFQPRTSFTWTKIWRTRTARSRHNCFAWSACCTDRTLWQPAGYRFAGQEDRWHQNDMEVLGKLTTSDLVDLACRMTLNAKGQEVFNFGKHKGKVVTAVLKEEPAYYDWMMNGDFPMDTKRKLTEIKLRSF